MVSSVRAAFGGLVLLACVFQFSSKVSYSLAVQLSSRKRQPEHRCGVTWLGCVIADHPPPYTHISVSLGFLLYGQNFQRILVHSPAWRSSAFLPGLGKGGEEGRGLSNQNVTFPPSPLSSV